MPANTREILTAFATVLVNDSVLCDPTVGILPLYGPDNLAPLRSNAIFYPRPPTPRIFPCITVADAFTRPSIRDQQDRKNRRVMVAIEVEVWGQSSGGGTQVDLGLITTEIDGIIEGYGTNLPCWCGGAMDTSDWLFQGIDTSGNWHVEALADKTKTRVTESRSKTYWVTAADKTD